MIAGLRTLQARFQFDLEIADVDAEPTLESHYGGDVPVLVHGEHELCRHALNPTLIADYLTKIG